MCVQVQYSRTIILAIQQSKEILENYKFPPSKKKAGVYDSD